MHVGQPAVDAVMTERQPLVVDPEEMENRRVEVVKAIGRLDGFPRPLVGLAVRDTRLQAGADEPGHERAAVVVAPFAALTEGHSTELGRPDQQGIVEQAACLEVFDQAGDGLVGLLLAIDSSSLSTSAWLSQLPAAPPAPLQTWTKRTPRSIIRRAVRQRRPKSSVVLSSSP